MKEQSVTNNLLDKTSFFWIPEYLSISAWIEHIPFAFWIIEVLKPKKVVELGIHNGISYFSFCQAVKRLNIDTTCYGVDTWQGDQHSGAYEATVFKNVMERNTREYSRFSTLIRSTFDEANNYFIDGSIDLLHIDGLHTYDAVKHDFETWLPKLTSNAIVVFHDINVRERDFGVYQYWEELKQQYKHFQFDFGHGLGIISMGAVPCQEMSALLNETQLDEYYFFLRNLFSDRGSAFKYQFDTAQLMSQQRAAFEAQEKIILQITESNQILELNNSNSKQKNDELVMVVDKEKESAITLKLNSRALNDANIELSIINEQLKESLQETRQNTDAVKEKNIELSTINAQLKENLLETRLNSELAKEKNIELSIISAQVKESLEEIILKCKEVEQRNMQLLLEKEQLKDDLTVLKLTTEKAKADNNRLAFLNGQLKESNNSFQEQHDQMQEDNLQLATNLQQMKKACQQFETDSNQLNESYLAQVAMSGQLNAINKTLEANNQNYQAVVKKLSEKLETANFSFNEVIKELSDENGKISQLNTLLQSQKQIVSWYKATYEDRTMAGVLKEMLASKFKKKIGADNQNGGNSIDKITSDNISPKATEVKNVLKSNEEKSGYHLVPANDVTGYPESNEYTSTGSDPYFMIEFKTDSLKAGWYWLSVDVTVVEGMLLSPILYFDYGRGFNEEDVWDLPAIKDGKIACLIHFPIDILKLRFDPTTTISTFKVKDFDLKFTGKVKTFQIGLAKYKSIYSPDESYLTFYSGLMSTVFKTGKSNLREKVREGLYYKEKNSWNKYSYWCALYDTISPAQLEQIKIRSNDLVAQPLFSIVMPVYNAPVAFLKKAIESVRKQAYQNWELCIADDRSTDKNVKKLLEEYREKDARVKVVFRETNGHISNASNSALSVATGDFIVLLDQDDELPVHCLYMVAEVFGNNPDLGIIYSDEDKIDEGGNRFDPYFKTDWNKDLFYGQNLISHLGVYKHDLIKKVGGFRAGYEGSQDYDLALRCLEHLKPGQIHHIPHVLYHWRAIKGSTAVTISNKNYAVNAGLNALQDHLERTGQAAVAEENIHNSYRVKWAMPDKEPLVSIIIPTKDKADILSNCITSIFQNTSYTNFEILIIDNNSEEPATHTYFGQVQREHQQVKVLLYNGGFNFSAMNNFGVQQSKGDILVLLNNDTAVINSDWLGEMVSQCLREEVGAVGAKLFYPNGQIQHAGVFLHEGHPGNHIYLKRDKNDPGYFNKLNLVQNYVAVTAACLAVRKDVYMEAEGLDEQNLKVAYNDVDFCLKLFTLGYRNVWTPFSQLTHYESLSRGNDLDEVNFPRFKKEHSHVLNKWKDLVLNDPFYNPNLGIDTETTQFAFPPKIRYQWQEQIGQEIL